MSGFVDVGAGHPFAADVAWLVERGITTGYPDGTFRPSEPVTRGQMAAFLYRYAGSPETLLDAVPRFADVPPGAPFAREIAWLAGRGITLGSGGLFKPTEPVLRQQMAAFLHRFDGAPAVTAPARPTFADVDASSPFFLAIEWLAARGVTRGSRGADGVLRFDPGGTVSRGQMAAFLHRFDTPLPAVDVHHLLRRTTYGSTPDLLADVAASGGPLLWLERQLSPQSIDDSACDAALASFPLTQASPPELDTRIQRFNWDAMFELQAATIARATLSRRQLLEVMTELWSNHLNVTCPSSDVWSTRPEYDRLVRRHALGRFEDLLVATATSPAMLRYLDGASSRGSTPNENWGRELLELHTVGRDSGYTQADVVAASRALTGLTCWDPWNGGTAENMWAFRYRPEWHHVGPLQVLGWSHPNASADGGIDVAQDLLRYLARHPSTARRIARRLAVRFVSDDPPAALVDRLAAVYLASGTDVVPVLRALFTSPEFAASVGAKTRTPYEDGIATLRALGAAGAPGSDGEGWRGLVWYLGGCGQAPLSWPAPDGYPDVAAAWSSAGSVLQRWNLHAAVAGRWMKGGISWPDLRAHLLPTVPATRAELVRALFDRLIPGVPVPAAQSDALVTFLGGPGPVKDADVTWLFWILVALVLDSPLWSTR